MGKTNKAHTATVNRLAKRYGAKIDDGEGPDLKNDCVTIEVETTATVGAGIKRLREESGPTFVALTNKEGVAEAVRKIRGTGVGVMDPRGEIVQQSDPPLDDEPT